MIFPVLKADLNTNILKINALGEFNDEVLKKH